MAQVKLDFTGKTVPEKIEYSGSIVKKMTGNPNFTTPDPTLVVVTAGITALKDAYTDALDGGKTKTAIKNKREKELNALMNSPAIYVEFICKGDELKILSSGMGVKSKGTPVSSLDTPLSLIATPSGQGEIDLTWTGVASSKSYDVQITTDPNTLSTWVHLDIATEAKYTAKGLVSGKQYWFRIAAVGPRGLKSDWSDPAGSMAG